HRGARPSTPPRLARTDSLRGQLLPARKARRRRRRLQSAHLCGDARSATRRVPADEERAERALFGRRRERRSDRWLAVAASREVRSETVDACSWYDRGAGPTTGADRRHVRLDSSLIRRRSSRSVDWDRFRGATCRLAVTTGAPADAAGDPNRADLKVGLYAQRVETMPQYRDHGRRRDFVVAVRR